MEKAAIKRLDGHELVAKYPEEFADSVERDFNFCILTQTIHRNHRQDLKVSLQAASKAVREIEQMSPRKKDASDNLLPKSLST